MKKIIIAILVIFIGTTSCDSGFEELNVNPNTATELEPGPKLTNAILRTAGRSFRELERKSNLLFNDDTTHGLNRRCLGGR